MTNQEILARVDHTLLKADATWPQIKAICDEAIEAKTASICINTCICWSFVQFLAFFIKI